MSPEIYFEDLKELIAKQWDETELLDALDIDMIFLVEILASHIEAEREKIIRMLYNV